MMEECGMSIDGEWDEIDLMPVKVKQESAPR